MKAILIRFFAIMFAILFAGCVTTPAPVKYEIKEIRIEKISLENQMAIDKAVAEMKEATKDR